MRTEYKTLKLTQKSSKEAPEPISDITDQFSNVVLSAAAALKGWELRFSDSDRPFHRGYVRITSAEVVDERKVKVTVEIGLRDKSGEWDDEYEGEADVLVMAQVADN